MPAVRPRADVAAEESLELAALEPVRGRREGDGHEPPIGTARAGPEPRTGAGMPSRLHPPLGGIVTVAAGTARLPPVRVALILNRDAGGGAASEQRDAALEALRAAGVEPDPVQVRPDEFTRAARRGRAQPRRRRGGRAATARCPAWPPASSAATRRSASCPSAPSTTSRRTSASRSSSRARRRSSRRGTSGASTSARSTAAPSSTTRRSAPTRWRSPCASACRSSTGYGKWLAMARASLTVFKRLPVLTVELRADGEPVELCTPIVFVGNGEYDVATLPPGRRDAPGRGLPLPLHGARRGPPPRAAAGRANPGRAPARRGATWRRGSSASSRCTSIARALPVAVDGEVLRLEVPLRYRSAPRALPVLAPRRRGRRRRREAPAPPSPTSPTCTSGGSTRRSRRRCWPISRRSRRPWSCVSRRSHAARPARPVPRRARASSTGCRRPTSSCRATTTSRCTTSSAASSSRSTATAT